MAAIAGDDWKPEYEAAWSAALGTIAAVMIEGAEHAERQALAA
jgi:hemoglobin-like flavoprotein